MSEARSTLACRYCVEGREGAARINWEEVSEVEGPGCGFATILWHKHRFWLLKQDGWSSDATFLLGHVVLGTHFGVQLALKISGCWTVCDVKTRACMCPPTFRASSVSDALLRYRVQISLTILTSGFCVDEDS